MANGMTCLRHQFQMPDSSYCKLLLVLLMWISPSPTVCILLENLFKYSLHVIFPVPPIIDGATPEEGPRLPYNIVQTQDDSIVLPCQASGNPPPMIVWYKDGRRVTHNSRGVQMSADSKQLIIRRAETIHTGTYICVAMSSVGNASKTFVVHVNGMYRTDGQYPALRPVLLDMLCGMNTDA